MSIFRLYPRLKMSFEHNSDRKTFFQVNVSVGLLDFHYVRQMKKITFGGTISYGDSYLELSVRHFKVFRLQALLHVFVGAEKSHGGEDLGHSHMIGQGPNSCLLGHVTGILFFLYLKLFLLSIFISVDF